MNAPIFSIISDKKEATQLEPMPGQTDAQDKSRSMADPGRPGPQQDLG